jgi:ABC-type phosphate transport system permease subunit
MKDTEALMERTGETVEYLKLYAQQQVDIVKLDAVEKSAKVISSMITSLVLGVVALVVLLFLAIAGALFLGQILDNTALGFFIGSLIFVLVGALLYGFRKSIITSPIVALFIAKIYEEED